MVFLSAFWLVVLCLILEFFMLPVYYILGPSLVSLHISLSRSGMVKIWRYRDCSAFGYRGRSAAEIVIFT